MVNKIPLFDHLVLRFEYRIIHGSTDVTPIKYLYAEMNRNKKMLIDLWYLFSSMTSYFSSDNLISYIISVKYFVYD